MASQFSGKIQEGFEVWSSDEKKLGKVVAIHTDTFVCEKGFFFPKDYTLAFDDVREVRGDSVILSRTQEEVGIHGGFWTTNLGSAPGKITGTSTREQAEAPYATRAETTEAPYAGYERPTDVVPPVHGKTAEEIRIPLREEEVRASTHVEQTGEVRIHKHVVTEERQVTVPVSREVVTVERVPVSNQSQLSSEKAFEEQSVTVPIREGVIDIEKRPVVREEIQVTKSTEEMDQPVSTTVRREVAEVERAPDMPYKKTGTTG